MATKRARPTIRRGVEAGWSAAAVALLMLLVYLLIGFKGCNPGLTVACRWIPDAPCYSLYH